MTGLITFLALVLLVLAQRFQARLHALRQVTISTGTSSKCCDAQVNVHHTAAPGSERNPPSNAAAGVPPALLSVRGYPCAEHVTEFLYSYYYLCYNT